MSLTDKGFERPNYNDVVNQMETDAKELYGQDVNTSEQGPLGIFLRVISWPFARVWEAIEDTYNNLFISKAEGVALDYRAVSKNTIRQPAQFATTTVSITGTPLHTIVAGTRYEREDGFDYTLIQDVILDANGNGTGEVVALTPGIAGNTPANTITVQSELDSEVDSVTNAESATDGRERETDKEFRARLLASKSANATNNKDSIITNVRNVPGVRAANIENNRTLAAIGDLPAKSMRISVLGGDSQDIANAIFEKITASSQTVGTTAVNVIDNSGEVEIIRFQRATERPIYITVTVETDSTFETNGDTQIKNAIVQYIGGIGSDGNIYTGLTMGADVILTKIIYAVMQVQGVTDAQVKIGTSADPTGTSNIALSTSEVAQTDTTKILVNVL